MSWRGAVYCRERLGKLWSSCWLFALAGTRKRRWISSWILSKSKAASEGDSLIQMILGPFHRLFYSLSTDEKREQWCKWPFQCEDELAPTDSVPFGIMITDSETRKSVVLLEAPILESWLQRVRFHLFFAVSQLSCLRFQLYFKDAPPQRHTLPLYFWLTCDVMRCHAMPCDDVTCNFPSEWHIQIIQQHNSCPARLMQAAWWWWDRLPRDRGGPTLKDFHWCNSGFDLTRAWCDCDLSGSCDYAINHGNCPGPATPIFSCQGCCCCCCCCGARRRRQEVKVWLVVRQNGASQTSSVVQTALDVVS